MRYLDHAATSPPRDEALRAMWPFVTAEFGNPSSIHERGRATAQIMDWARSTVADALGGAPADVVFTSGGTEANNLAIAGLALAHPRGRHIVSARTEHSSVQATIAWLERWHGFETSWLELESDGSLAPGALERALRPDSTLVTLMAVNNEVGTRHDIRTVATTAHAVGALVHSDVVQAIEWIDPSDWNVDALSVSGHKIGAPQGIGVALIRAALDVEPTVWGGGQQHGRRSGTENVPGAVALATALALATRERSATQARVRELSHALIRDVQARHPGALLTGSPLDRAPHIASFVFPGLNGEAILIGMEERGVQCSSGSACSAGRSDPSQVLTALGFDADTALTAVRVSFGRDSTTDDVSAARDALDGTLAQLGWTAAG